MPEHDVAPLGEIHRLANWEYADATARLAATGFTPAHLGKWAKQLSDGTYWELTDDSPIVWEQRTSILPPDAATREVGYLEIPQNPQSTNYTTVLSDSGKHIYHPSSDNNPRTYTIDKNADIPYPIGTAITFVNRINTLTIAIDTDTLIWSEDGSVGSRTLAPAGMATALKVENTEWLISGTGLS